jgi:hypothetical protein
MGAYWVGHRGEKLALAPNPVPADGPGGAARTAHRQRLASDHVTRRLLERNWWLPPLASLAGIAEIAEE